MDAFGKAVVAILLAAVLAIFIVETSKYVTKAAMYERSTSLPRECQEPGAPTAP